MLNVTNMTAVWQALLGLIFSLTVEVLMLVEGILLQYVNPGMIGLTNVPSTLSALGESLVSLLAQLVVKILKIVETLLEGFGFTAP
jgi:hypothetical protein